MIELNERDLALLKAIHHRKVHEPDGVVDQQTLQRLERYGFVSRQLGRYKVARTSSDIASSIRKGLGGMVQPEELRITASGLREYHKHFYPNGSRKHF